MSYENAMTTAGAEIHNFESFGSYQGDWWAKVTYEGKTGWINGSYGSCSGCDAFQSEFSFQEHDCGNDTYYNPIYYEFRESCTQCQEVKTRLIAFGKRYLEDMLTQEQAEEHAARNIEWDDDAQEMIDFIKKNKVG